MPELGPPVGIMPACSSTAGDPATGAIPEAPSDGYVLLGVGTKPGTPVGPGLGAEETICWGWEYCIAWEAAICPKPCG